jgi:hypothetical protein
MKIVSKGYKPFSIITKAIIDTGSERTIMTDKLAKTLFGPDYEKELKPIDLTLKSVTGNILKLKGCLTIALAIDIALIEHHVVVMVDTKSEFILGNDLISDNINILNNRTISIKLKDGTYTKPIKVFYNMPILSVRTATELTLEPRTVHETQGILIDPSNEFDWKYHLNKDIIIMPTESDMTAAVVRTTLDTSKIERVARIIIENQSDEPIIIEADTIVGTAQYLCGSDLNVFQPVKRCSFIHEQETLENVLHGSKDGNPPLPPGLTPDKDAYDPKINNFEEYKNDQQIGRAHV